MKAFRHLLSLFAVVAVVTGCGSSQSLEIESSTTWEGTITEGSAPAYAIKGTGSTSIGIKSDDNFCWSIQKQTDVGLLHAYAKLTGFMRDDRGGEKLTYDAFGVVAGCSGEF